MWDSHLCELLWGCGQYGHGAVQFGEEFIRQMTQTRPACPFQDHPQASLNLQHFGALEPTPRWACKTHTHTQMCFQTEFVFYCTRPSLNTHLFSHCLLQELKVNLSGTLGSQAILYHPIGCQWGFWNLNTDIKHMKVLYRKMHHSNFWHMLCLQLPTRPSVIGLCLDIK